MNAPLTKEQIALLMSDTVSTPVRVSLWSRVSDAFTAWTVRRAVAAELRSLSDRELTDIGLSRSDLGRVFDPAFARSREQAVFRAANY